METQKIGGSVVLGLVEAVTGWLIADIGRAGVAHGSRLIMGDEQLKALRRIVETSVRELVRGTSLKPDQQKHLGAVLAGIGRKQPVGLPVTSEAGLRSALNKWMVTLDRSEFGSPGYLTGMGLSPVQLADDLADTILRAVRDEQRRNGPLRLLAEWLWRDEVSAELDGLGTQLEDVSEQLAQLRAAVAGQALSAVPGKLGDGLPGEVDHFVGRTEALSALRQRVKEHTPDGIVVSIHALTGMAGVGKTALAVHAAHGLSKDYPDGAFFIDLYGYTSGVSALTPEEALAELLRQGGVSPVPAGLVARKSAWRGLHHGRRMIVLLDNVRDAGQVRDLLPMAPGCLVMITSRSRLTGLVEATPLSVDVLTAEEASALFVAVAGPHRCGDQAAVDRLVRSVGCLPLAVRLAAGRLRVDRSTTVATIAFDLENTMSRLDDLSPEEAGVRASFAASVGALSLTQRWAFIVVGVFPGPILTASSFAAACGLTMADAQQRLRELADLHLLDIVEAHDGRPRYEAHDLVRDYARELAVVEVSAEERSTMLTRLGECYAELSRTADRDALLAERDNLVAFAAVAGGLGAPHVYLSLGDGLLGGSYYTHASRLYAASHDRFSELGDRSGLATAWLGLARTARATGDYTTATSHGKNAMTLFGEIGDRVGRANALAAMASIARHTGDYMIAEKQGEQALTIYAATNNVAGRATALFGLAETARLTGHYRRATHQYQQALMLYNQIGNRAGAAYALTGLAATARHTGDFPTAADQYQQALDLYSAIGTRLGRATALFGLAETGRLIGQYPRAADQYQQALVLYSSIGNRAGWATSLFGLAATTRATGDFTAAARHGERALSLYDEIGDRAGLANALAGLAEVAVHVGDFTASITRYTQALTVYTEIGHRLGRANALAGLALVAECIGAYDTAEDRGAEALALYTTIGHRLGRANALAGLSAVARLTGDIRSAEERGSKALALYVEIGHQFDIGEPDAQLAYISQIRPIDTARSIPDDGIATTVGEAMRKA